MSTPARSSHAEAESDDLHRRHAHYYLVLAEAAKSTYFTTPSKAVAAQVSSGDGRTFRGALHWSLALGKDIKLGATLAGALVMFLSHVSPNESLRWTRMALARLPADSEPAIEAALWYGVGRAAENLPADQMRAAAERAVALARVAGNQQLLGEALRQLMVVLGWYYPDEQAFTREPWRAKRWTSARALGEPIEIALALRSLSVSIDNANVAASWPFSKRA